MQKIIALQALIVAFAPRVCPVGAGDEATATEPSGGSSSTTTDGTTEVTIPTTGETTTPDTLTATESMTGSQSDSTGTTEAGPALCGNGDVEVGEECDDRNDDNTDACLSNCQNAKCGDGFVYEGVESCDDRDCAMGGCEPEQLKSSHCYYSDCDEGECSGPGSCSAASCGDGQINTPLDEAMDECDDGKNNKAPEEYAEAAPSPGDATCTAACKTVKWCGDGVVFEEREECDEVSDECTGCYEPRYVFVTETFWTGNLGGLEEADKKCAEEASESPFTPKSGGFVWRAWLSDGSGSPASRIKEDDYNGYYKIACKDGRNMDLKSFVVSKNVNGGFVPGWPGLMLEGGQELSHAINCDQYGAVYKAGDTSASELVVWTNVNVEGVSNVVGDCGGWKNANGGVKGGIGDLTSVAGSWTNDGNKFEFCSSGRRFYCFQVRLPE